MTSSWLAMSIYLTLIACAMTVYVCFWILAETVIIFVHSYSSCNVFLMRCDLVVNHTFLLGNRFAPVIGAPASCVFCNILLIFFCFIPSAFFGFLTQTVTFWVRLAFFFLVTSCRRNFIGSRKKAAASLPRYRRVYVPLLSLWFFFFQPVDYFLQRVL